MNKPQLEAILKTLPDDAWSIIVVGHNSSSVFFSTQSPEAKETFINVNESKQLAKLSGGGFRCRADGNLQTPEPECCTNPAICAGRPMCPRDPMCTEGGEQDE